MNDTKIDPLGKVPIIDSRYYQQAYKDRNVVILGSSKNTKALEKYLEYCANLTRIFIENGYNIVHGCGINGIMGAAYETAQQYSQKDKNGVPVQNLGIVRIPPWEDNNLEGCVLIGKAKSEAERIDHLSKISDNFLIFPGSAGTMQEATTLVQKNVYEYEKRKIVLFGNEFWNSFAEMFKKMSEFGFINKEKLGKLFMITTDPKAVLKFFDIKKLPRI